MGNTYMKKGRTLHFKKNHPEAFKWVEWLEKNCIGSCGPNPSIVGMRHTCYGKDALLVKAGQYVYYMGKDEGQSMPWE